MTAVCKPLYHLVMARAFFNINEPLNFAAKVTTCTLASLVTDWSLSFQRSLEQKKDHSTEEVGGFCNKISNKLFACCRKEYQPLRPNLICKYTYLLEYRPWWHGSQKFPHHAAVQAQGKDVGPQRRFSWMKIGWFYITSTRGNSEGCPKNIWNPAFFSKTEPSLTLNEL